MPRSLDSREQESAWRTAWRDQGTLVVPPPISDVESSGSSDAEDYEPERYTSCTHTHTHLVAMCYTSTYNLCISFSLSARAHTYTHAHTHTHVTHAHTHTHTCTERLEASWQTRSLIDFFRNSGQSSVPVERTSIEREVIGATNGGSSINGGRQDDHQRAFDLERGVSQWESGIMCVCVHTHTQTHTHTHTHTRTHTHTHMYACTI